MTFIKSLKSHEISTGNTTTSLLGAGATFTGAWESVIDFATVGVAIKGDNATDGTLYIESSQDGGTVVNSVPFDVTDASFDLPHLWNVIESYIRIRYVNGSTAQTGHFQLQTKYSNAQQLGLLQNAKDVITGETDVQIVKAVTTGTDPEGVYKNSVSTGVSDGNTTSTPLGIGGTFTGNWVSTEGYHGSIVSISGTANVGGTLFLEFSLDGVNNADGLGTSAVIADLTDVTPRTVAIVGPYFRVRYTNNGVAQTTFNIWTRLQTERVDLTATTSQLLESNEDVRLSRPVSSVNDDINYGLFNHIQAKRKFGVNEAVGNGNLEDVWAEGGLYVLPTTAETVRVQAGGNAADTSAGAGARTVVIEGLDENWNEVIETLTLAGTSASSPSTTTFIRINKTYVATVGTANTSNVGVIRVENTISTNVLAHIPAGSGNTAQAIYTVPAGKTAYVTALKVSVGQSDSADVTLWHTQDGAVATPYKHNEYTVEDFSGFVFADLKTELKFDERETIGVNSVRITGSGTARVSADFDFYLKDNS